MAGCTYGFIQFILLRVLVLQLLIRALQARLLFNSDYYLRLMYHWRQSTAGFLNLQKWSLCDI